jgi:UDP-glucose 4-epimerase
MKNINEWNVLITGAAGFIGSSLIERFIKVGIPFQKIIGTDVRPPRQSVENDKYEFHLLDVRDEGLSTFIKNKKISHIVHLASIVTPGKNSHREFEYSVDVLGTKNILKSATENNVRQIIVTSSGAAYGYHKDNPDWIKETDEIRGNFEFPYSYHKKLVEEELKIYREQFPNFKQLILRPGTILGKNVNNQITDLFKKPVLLGIKNSKSPFVFIWDEDVIEIIYQGLINEKEGIYNLAGDGALTLKEISTILKKPYLSLPADSLKNILKILKKFNLTQYGPEQVNFLRYRPVLFNQKLKTEFGFIPKYSSKECFAEYLKHQRFHH